MPYTNIEKPSVERALTIDTLYIEADTINELDDIASTIDGLNVSISIYNPIKKPSTPSYTTITKPTL